MERRPWTREELLAVLSLYCVTPFGKMHSKNVEVVYLAKQVSRTPSAVALKLVNFASFDPAHQRRGVSGMSNASKLDREVWDAYYEKWDALAAADQSAAVYVDDVETQTPETQTTATIQARKGQGYFRRVLLAAYGHRCCLTGITHRELIRASHIVPWAAKESSRLDPHNGLILSALHDAAFDKGLVTFDDDRKLILSGSLRDQLDEPAYANFFGRYENQAIQSPERFEPLAEYLQYHRKHLFQN